MSNLESSNIQALMREAVIYARASVATYLAVVILVILAIWLGSMQFFLTALVLLVVAISMHVTAFARQDAVQKARR